MAISKTYLQLCQDTAKQCGIATAGLTTVVGQTGQLLQLCEWVRDAYIELQAEKDWRWLRKKFTLATVDGTDTYAFGSCVDVETGLAIDRFKSWKIDDSLNPPTIYLTTAGVAGQIWLTYTNWDYFEALYHTGSLQSSTAFPVHVTEDPDHDLVLGITPNDIYTLTGTYYRAPQELALDADVPEMPPEFHRLIMYEAMMFYADFENADEVERRATRGIKRLGPSLRRKEGPRIRLGKAMA
jgi:hypothetical protein